MPPYTQHPNSNIEMKIEHTTYDAAHKIRTRRPSTAAEKIRNFFSLKSDKKDHVLTKKVRFDLSNLDSEQPTRTLHPPANISQALAQQEAIWEQQQQEQKALKLSMKNVKTRVVQPSKPPPKTSRRVAPHGNLKDAPPSPPPKNVVEEVQPQHQQQPNNKASNTIATARREEEKPDSTHVPLYGWRSNKSSTFDKSSHQTLDDKVPGKISKRNPPHSSKPKSCQTTTISKFNSGDVSRRLQHAPNKRLDLQPSQHSPVNHRVPTSISKPARKEPLSAIISLNTSTDLLDAKRRDLKLAFNKRTEKFQPPPLLSHEQRQELIDDDESASDESFFCSGDPIFTTNANSQLSTKEQRSPRTSEDVTTPMLLAEKSEDSCRLCHIRSPAGIRGICIQCENTYCSPQPDFFEDLYQIEPTLPLKIRTKPTNQRPDPDSPPPTPPLKENEVKMLKVHNVGAKPTVITAPLNPRSSCRAVMGNIEPAVQNIGRKPTVSPATIKRHQSQRAVMGRVESIGGKVRKPKPISKSARWQTGGVRSAYEGMPTEAPLRSDGDESSNYGSTISTSPGRDMVSLFTGQKKSSGNEKTLQHSESFYGFYDQLLRDHGASTPKAEKLLRRYDEL